MSKEKNTATIFHFFGKESSVSEKGTYFRTKLREANERRIKDAIASDPNYLAVNHTIDPASAIIEGTRLSNESSENEPYYSVSTQTSPSDTEHGTTITAYCREINGTEKRNEEVSENNSSSSSTFSPLAPPKKRGRTKVSSCMSTGGKAPRAPKKRVQSNDEHARGSMIDLCGVDDSDIEQHHDANEMQRNDEAPDLGPLYDIKYNPQFHKCDSDDSDTFPQSCYI